MAEHNEIGKRGESIAVDMLRADGLKIRERNWTMGHLETDIIAENRKEIVFVEVKTRTSMYGGKRPEEYVDERKRRRMVASANAYIRENGITKEPRFDIIGILIDRQTLEVKEKTHLKDAFVPRCKTVSTGTFSGIWRWLHRHKLIR